MKTKNYSTFLASAEVFGVDISLICGDITITGTDEFIFKTQRASHSYVKVTEQGGKVKIKQFRKPFFHRAEVNVYVPKICLPDLNIKLKNGKITIKDGVYGDLRLKARTADVDIANSAFAGVEIVGNTLNLECSATSVGGSLLCTADEGKALITGGSCTKIYLTYKQGDYGVSDFNFRDGVYTLGEGSINLCLNGNRDDYSLDLLAKNGTCSESHVCEGLYALKAYTGNGNITVDFTKSDGENGND